jgi:galactofuranose transport system substrate-binding protein
MKVEQIKVLLVAVAALALVATACAPPLARPVEGQSAEIDGPGTEQVVEENPDAPVCNVEPPDVTLDEAVVGFSQAEPENNPFRITETSSIQAEAEERGIDLLTTNAEASAPKQISDIRDMIAQGADILIVAPLQEQGLAPAFEAANEAGVPVFLIDRESAGEPCEDFITFMGSNFYRQGEQAAHELAKLTDEEANVAVLEGVPGASVTIDRTEGFEDALEEYSDMEIVASQTANFLRAEGQQVMEQLIQSNPDINAVYGQNDEMALGAVQALRDAGLDPGEEVKVVSIDGTAGAVQAIINGDMNAVIETNPRFGPLAFDTIEDFLAGEPIPQKTIVQDRVYDESNAEEALKSAY